jgi:MYXO-CTERM domain-containing protein
MKIKGSAILARKHIITKQFGESDWAEFFKELTADFALFARPVLATSVTQFPVDSGHANPYGVWANQGKPVAPTEAQWEAMRAAQHLLPAATPTQMSLSGSYSGSLTIPRQGAVLVTIGKSRPVTGRNGLVTILGEDYDGQSGVTLEDSGDTSMGQSVLGNSGSYEFFDSVDFSDAGVDTVQLRVNAQTATTLTLHADSATGTLVGTCAIPATSGWATETCTLMHTPGVHALYVSFGGTVHLNWLSFTGTADGGGASSSSSSSSGSSTMVVTTTTSSSTLADGGVVTTTGTSTITTGGGSSSGGSGGSGSGGGAGSTSGCGCTVVGNKGFGGSFALGALALAALRRRRARPLTC